MAHTATRALDEAQSCRKPQRNLFLRRFLRRPQALFGSLVILIFAAFALFSPWIAPYTPIEADYARVREPPSAEHIFGTDQLGRDVFSRIVYGARVSLSAGLIPVLLSMLIGVVFGLMAGFFGGKVDLIIMGLMDTLLAIPSLILMLGLTAVLGPNLQNALLIIAITGVPGFSRIARGQVLSVSAYDYVLAARSIGCRNGRILARHILPNILTPVIVTATLRIGGGIMAEASLSFLGLGVQPPTPSWGVMVAVGNQYIRIAPWLAIAPGAAIFLITLAANFLGDSLREATRSR